MLRVPKLKGAVSHILNTIQSIEYGVWEKQQSVYSR